VNGKHRDMKGEGKAMDTNTRAVAQDTADPA